MLPRKYVFGKDTDERLPIGNTLWTRTGFSNLGFAGKGAMTTIT